MGTLTLAFPVEPSKDRDALYRSALADLSDGAVLAAVVEIVKADHFFPKIARIREIAERAAAREYQVILADKTPTELLGDEFGRIWRGDAPQESASADLRTVVAWLGGWDAMTACPSWPQFVEACNRALFGFTDPVLVNRTEAVTA